MKVKLVYGPPCSGKSTYARSNAGVDDVIYDYDALRSAVTTETRHTARKDFAAHRVITGLRKSMVNWAKDNSDIDVFWMLARYPNDYIRGILEGLEVEEILMDTSKEECLERLKADESRPDKGEWEKLIEEWFDEHGKEGGNENRIMKRKFWNWIKNETEGSRTLFLNGEISDETWWGDEVTPKIFKDELNSGEEDITLWINSPGGDVFAAAQIYNMLMEYKGNVIVKIDSLAASAASVIAMAGTKVLMSPASLMMIHNPLTIAIGDTEEMQKAISMLNEVKESIINAYELKTGLRRSKISQLMDAETWLNAKKAAELGFADGILYEKTDEKPEPEAMLFSRRAVTNSLLSKFKVQPKGTPYSELEKRLNLLK